MGCASKQNQLGFTLVEISIVMIIVGLLIGGTFGGMKLIENMQVNKTVQDLKAIESAALTFKDTYGRLPGDMPNTAARLPNCTDAPCATGGNSDRAIDRTAIWNTALALTDERFTFWHHLQAANLLSMGYQNILDLNYGFGQPDAPIGAGYRVITSNTTHACHTYSGSQIYLGVVSSALITGTDGSVSCMSVGGVDSKIDDGYPMTGKVVSGACVSVAGCTAPYELRVGASAFYELPF